MSESVARGQAWVFTFGSGQTHPRTGEALDNRFLEIQAESGEEARKEMFQRFGKAWGSEYASRRDAGCVQYELRPLEGALALGFKDPRPFFGWNWAIALRLRSGILSPIANGKALTHAEARAQVERFTETFHPDDFEAKYELRTSLLPYYRAHTFDPRPGSADFRPSNPRPSEETCTCVECTHAKAVRRG